MKVTCRLRQPNKPSTSAVLDFPLLPHKGDLINPDEHGNGIHGYVEDVVWVYDNEKDGYYPFLVIKVYGAD